MFDIPRIILSITQRLGKKTIYGWTLVKLITALAQKELCFQHNKENEQKYPANPKVKRHFYQELVPISFFDDLLTLMAS